MKQFVFSLFILVGFSNNVFAQTIAQLPVKLSYDRYAITQLDDNRELIISTHLVQNANLFQEDVITQDTIRVSLTDELYTKMLFESIQLSNAKLDIRRQDIVCMMIAPPGPSEDLSVRSGYDREIGFTGELRQVQTQRGCWAHLHVTPEQEHLKLIAYQLIGQLNALTHQAVSSH
ncbi:MAG: hypothetical protein H6617_07315 [Bdellovibrionaceae bacterium]|nr:hypothetical protein [Pseudobdellovibrionaceae bacterium]